MAQSMSPSVSSKEYTNHDMLVILSLVSALGTGRWEQVAAAASKIHLPLFGRGSENEYTGHECQRIYSRAMQTFSRKYSGDSDKAALDKAIVILKDLRLDEIQSKLKDIDAVLNSPINKRGTSVAKETQTSELETDSSVISGYRTGNSDKNSTLSEPKGGKTRTLDSLASADKTKKGYTANPHAATLPIVQTQEVYADSDKDSAGKTIKSSFALKAPPTMLGEERPVKTSAPMAHSTNDDVLETAYDTVRETSEDGIAGHGSDGEQPSLAGQANKNSTRTEAKNNSVDSGHSKAKENQNKASIENEHTTIPRRTDSDTGSNQLVHSKEQVPKPVAEQKSETETNILDTKANIEQSREMTKERLRDYDHTASENAEEFVSMDDDAVYASASATTESKAASLIADEQQLKNWKKNINMVWRDLSGHRFGSMFISPIKSADAPKYYDVIRRPMDLKTIKNRVRDEEITTTVEFYRDIMHMLMNALMYNGEDTEVYQMAMEFIPDAQACVEQLLQTEEAVKHPETSGNSGCGNDSANVNAPSANVPLGPYAGGGLKSEDDSRTIEHHEEEDSDASSAPAKRRRRVASERASKHLRSG
ncbi:hypothetical protein IWW48_005382 [Coemansia sp. RSA 1200]|nr:hypothetical protein IWW48_005382 [Coemansia sp. RSA 1200]